MRRKALRKAGCIPPAQWLLPGTVSADGCAPLSKNVVFPVGVCARSSIHGEWGKTGCLYWLGRAEGTTLCDDVPVVIGKVKPADTTI
jgi:hypothetical protein